MKKLIGILGIAMIAMVMFFSTNTMTGSNNVDLLSLTTMNTANAENSCPCYNTYSTGGSWHITKCNGCTEVHHVDKRLDESTCPCNN